MDIVVTNPDKNTMVSKSITPKAPCVMASIQLRTAMLLDLQTSPAAIF